MRQLIRFLFIAAITTFLMACSNNENPETPRVLGIPWNTAFIDVFYEYEFGAEGGDDVLTYRLLSAPEWMSIESTNDAKLSFRIFGTPVIGSQSEFNDFIKEAYTIKIELSDGERSSIYSFLLTVEKNELSFDSNSVVIHEAEEKDYEPQQTPIDPDTGESEPEPTCQVVDLSLKEDNGVTLYPYPVVMSLLAPSESEVVIGVNVVSLYKSDKSETDIANIKYARPDVDYVDIVDDDEPAVMGADAVVDEAESAARQGDATASTVADAAVVVADAAVAAAAASAAAAESAAAAATVAQDAAAAAQAAADNDPMDDGLADAAAAAAIEAANAANDAANAAADAADSEVTADASEFVSDAIAETRDDTSITSAEKAVYAGKIAQTKIDADYKVVFEPGVTECVFVIDVYDDYRIEGSEGAIIETARLEGYVELPRDPKLTIVDNEPNLVFAGAEEYVTEGETSEQYTFELSETVDYEISVNLEARAGSTADTGDYSFDPEVLVFPANTATSSFRVHVSDDPCEGVAPGVDDVCDAGPGEKDEILYVDADVSKIFQLQPLTITINAWVDNKLVAASAAMTPSSSVALVVDSEGFVIALNTEDSGNTTTNVLMYDRVGDKQDLTANPVDATISAAGNNVAGVDLLSRDKGSFRELYVISNTDGDVGTNTNAGGVDVVVRKYRRSRGDTQYSLDADFGLGGTLQFGTTGNDLATGGAYDSNGNIYIYGTTDDSFTGASNQGKLDAFVYTIDEDGVSEWASMQGSSEDDIPSNGIIAEIEVRADDGTTSIETNFLLGGETAGQLSGTVFGGIDVFDVRYKDSVFESLTQWGTAYDDFQTAGLLFEDKVIESQLFWAGHTKGDLTQGEGGQFDPSASRTSQDVYLLNRSLSGDFESVVMFGDPDKADASVAMTEVLNNIVVGGYTEGVLPGEESNGGQDAFLSALTVVDEPPQIVWTTQFGAQVGAADIDDQVIDVAVHDDKKIMVLWRSRDSATMTNNDLYYITPVDGLTGKWLAQ